MTNTRTSIIDKIICKLCESTKVDVENVSDGLSRDITCPACGFVNINTRVSDLKALKCPQCHHYFVWDGRPLNMDSLKKNTKKSFWKRIFKKNPK